MFAISAHMLQSRTDTVLRPTGRSDARHSAKVLISQGWEMVVVTHIETGMQYTWTKAEGWIITYPKLAVV